MNKIRSLTLLSLIFLTSCSQESSLSISIEHPTVVIESADVSFNLENYDNIVVREYKNYEVYHEYEVEDEETGFNRIADILSRGTFVLTPGTDRSKLNDLSFVYDNSTIEDINQQRYFSILCEPLPESENIRYDIDTDNLNSYLDGYFGWITAGVNMTMTKKEDSSYQNQGYDLYIRFETKDDYDYINDIISSMID